MNIVDQRRTYQLIFLQSKQEIEIGNKDHLPLPIDELVKIVPIVVVSNKYFLQD
jgi:hypothetical protein